MPATLRVQRTKTGFFDKVFSIFRKREPAVVAGFPSGSASQSNINKAIWNEFGTSRGIPERPFMRNTMRNNHAKYQNALKASAAQILRGEVSLEVNLRKLGIMMQGDIQHEITALTSPPNAPSTIKQKGSSNPLIDTGEMRQAVTWKIEYGPH